MWESAESCGKLAVEGTPEARATFPTKHCGARVGCVWRRPSARGEGGVTGLGGLFQERGGRRPKYISTELEDRKPGARGCGVGAVPVWVVAGGPCGPDSPGASPSPERPACPRPRSATFAHDDRPVLFVRASSPVALAVVRATMAPPSGMGGSVGVCRDPLGCVREDQERTW